MSAESLVLVFLGAPGAGKGTYCKELIARYHTPQISTGDMFRTAVKEGSAIGLGAKDFMDQGALVPDDIVIGVVRDRIAHDDCKPGFILDGFPRNVSQAEALGGMLKEQGKALRAVLNLEVPTEILLKRLTGRRMCRSCSKGNFNVYSLPPKKEGVCDYCGGELYQRDDDREETILKRLKVYEEQTKPLIDYFDKRGQLVHVPMGGDIAGTAAKIFEAIEKRQAGV